MTWFIILCQRLIILYHPWSDGLAVCQFPHSNQVSFGRFINQIIIIQMLNNIGALGDGYFTLVAVPLALEGLDGSPARVFAMVD